MTDGHELSPYLYMQFMEPLGATDGSVEAAWEHENDKWRDDVVRATADLEPTMVRWGGIYTDYYRWREGVGPRERRPPMLNLMWGGVESNQIGTAEFVDFCRRVHAEPLVCVNFESDGREHFRQAKGNVRTGDAQEAADWVRVRQRPRQRRTPRPRLRRALRHPPLAAWQRDLLRQPRFRPRHGH